MATIIGTSADERLRGTQGADFISGGAGEDRILGLAGDDEIDSVDRPDNIFAGVVMPQSDFVFAGAGDDRVTGGRLDYLDGQDGNDVLSLNFNFDGPNLNPAPVTLAINANGVGRADDGTVIRGFESVNLTLTNGDDAVSTGNVRASLHGMNGDDVLTTGDGDDVVFGGGGNDTISTGAGNDVISGGSGNDTIRGGAGDDSLSFDPANEGADAVDLGEGSDTVSFQGFDTGQIRVTFTSADVGNGSALDGANAANEDGGLAVRIQREDADGNLIGDVSRFDDEGITFVEGTQGYTFDVRDLVSGTQRGDQFAGVVLGTGGNDTLSFFPPFREAQPFYYNAGMGDDTVVAGSGNDFLVGGAGNDTLTGNGGNDSLLGGAGNDVADFDVSTDGLDSVDLGADSDRVNVSSAAGGQVRLTFTSAEVGNGLAADGNTMANQDGGLAVRLSAEDGGDGLAGPVSRFDDEGVTFVAATPGLTFDVRDLVSGAARGDAFEVVTLGTSGNDTLTALDPARATYVNAGAGNDTVTGGAAADFLVGGAGDDTLNGGFGNDSFIGGGGNDRIGGDQGNDDLAGGLGDDLLSGNAGNDRLAGEDGNDNLLGALGDDVLLGGLGNDRLAGGLGDDDLTGGAGADLFVFTAADGATSDDIVRDFELGVDHLVLRGLSVASIADSDAGARITYSNGATTTLQGIDAESLTPGDVVIQNGGGDGLLV
ncbi:calcium-binding protein [Aurantimonas sp. Leaf443]|uniref:calcium-binding protein n=1 Tax=Aurantimonas sp. Leaf443 TaxID=1736378 RepID=UPI000712BFA1|nr:calcium-binding protein [Aurantimonas sp. Leaf443]KQT85325.1 hypothetical protein ASG48_08740 [Aurantimonas sp. Leaf443]